MKNKSSILNLRKAKGWTQEQLADQSGLSIRTIQRLESGSDASLDTLRLVAEALNVSVEDLFIQVEDPNKEKEITEFTEEQSSQISKRQADENLFRLLKTSYFVLMLISAAFIGKVSIANQAIVGTIWAAIFILGFAILRYVKSAWWEPQLDSKYPLTKSSLHTTKSNKHEEFFWWKNPIVRPIMMIFWGVIIPLIFILKDVLN
ncbi:helix-turn-helix domain-containing protein [Lentilactobacillus senioris]|uniref:helix-turn-helix domain-containing protein n=1 Tax=Lentilactobacillus senioris TaxID=931534 RepID=UPI003D280DDC